MSSRDGGEAVFRSCVQLLPVRSVPPENAMIRPTDPADQPLADALNRAIERIRAEAPVMLVQPEIFALGAKLAGKDPEAEEFSIEGQRYRRADPKRSPLETAFEDLELAFATQASDSTEEAESYKPDPEKTEEAG